MRISKNVFCNLTIVLFWSATLIHCGGDGVDPPPPAPPLTSKAYFVGNSLTWDMNPPRLEEISLSRNVNLRAAYHIDCGAWLSYIYANPNEVCVTPLTPPGTFQPALSQFSFDIVVFQPYPGATLNDDVTAISAIVGMTKSKDAAKFFIYQGWPQPKPISYSDAWLAASPEADGTPTAMGHEYFQRLQARLVSKRITVIQIPVGEVLFELDGMIKRGEITSQKVASAVDLYRDNAHLNGTGQAIAGLTAFSAMYAKNPTGAVPASYGDVETYGFAHRPEVQAMIWRVVRAANNWP
jgi:hypothetical protein